MTTTPPILETGATVQIPLFLEEGQVIRVDRRVNGLVTSL
jgi:hypothetical protein